MESELQQLARAVQCAYDPSAVDGVASSSERHAIQLQATQFCEGVRSSPRGWQLALELFVTAHASPHAKFFALSTLQEGLGGRQQAVAVPHLLDHPCREAVRRRLFQWLAERLPANNAAATGSGAVNAAMTEESYVRTKLAVVLALLLKNDFPERWPSAFDELFQLAAHGPTMAELLLRTLCAVDEEIVTYHVDRRPEEVAHNSLIKDTMRFVQPQSKQQQQQQQQHLQHLHEQSSAPTSVLAGLSVVVQQIVRTYEAAAPALAALALTTFQRYIGWIDAAYVTDGAFMGLLYECLRRRPLSEAALGCLLEVVNKGMDEAPKAALLAQLRIFALMEVVPFANQSGTTAHHGDGGSGAGGGGGGGGNGNGDGGGDDDDDGDLSDIAEAAASVVNAAGTQLLGYWDQLEPTLASDHPAVVVGVGGGGGGLVGGGGNNDAAVAATCEMLAAAMPLLFRFLAHNDVDVSSAAVPMAMRLLDTLRRQLEDADNDAQQAPGGSGGSGSGSMMGGSGSGSISSGGGSSDFSSISSFNSSNGGGIGGGGSGGRGGSAGGVGFVAAHYLPELLAILHRQLHYSAAYDFADSDEDEAEEEIHRRNVRKVFLKAVRICPAQTLHFVCEVLSASLIQQGNPRFAPLSSLPFQQAEAALRLVYHYGEGLGSSARHQPFLNEGAFPQLVFALHRSDVAAHPHWCVTTLYFELAERYWKLLRKEPSLVGPVLERMCGPCGLTSAHPTLRGRTCFLLKSLVRRLGQHMAPFTGTVLHGVRELLFGGLMDPADMGHLFELASLLISSAALDPPTQAAHLEAMVHPILAGIEEGLQQAAANQGVVRADLMAGLGERLATKLSFLAYLTKGAARPVAHLQQTYDGLYRASIAALGAFPRHPSVRSKFMVVTHRMVTCMAPARLLELLPHVFSLLIEHLEHLVSAVVKDCDDGQSDDFALRDLDALVPLVNQLIIRYGAALHAALEPVVMRLFGLILACCESDTQAAAASQQHAAAAAAAATGGGTPAGAVVVAMPHVVAHLLNLQRHYFMVTHHVVSHDLASVLISERNTPHLERLLGTVISGIVEEGQDPVVQKLCVSIMRELVGAWVVAGKAGAGLNVASFVDFTMDKVVPACLSTLTSPAFRPKDANSVRVIGEVAAFLLDLQRALGPPFLAKLVEGILPSLRFPPPLVQLIHRSFEECAGPQDATPIQKALRACLAQS